MPNYTYFSGQRNGFYYYLGPLWTNKLKGMAIKKEFKVWLHGRRLMLFKRLKEKRDVSNASLLREMIDFYFENNPDTKS